MDQQGHSSLEADHDLRRKLPRLSPRRSLLREIVETILVVFSIYCAVNLATARFVVEGASMAPNFHSDELILVSRITYLLGDPRRGDVIVFHDPEDTSRDFIKRVIGLPGETIKIREGKVYVNDVPLNEPYIAALCAEKRCDGTWTLTTDQFFVLGDNRNNSHDGHSFGPLNRVLIVGQALARYWPPAEWGVIPHYDYDVPRQVLAATPTAGNGKDTVSYVTK